MVFVCVYFFSAQVCGLPILNDVQDANGQTLLVTVKETVKENVKEENQVRLGKSF